MSLLSTKTQIPPLPSRIVQRRRLSDRLNQGLQPNIHLTLVSAPAGYGKTTLLSTWAHSRNLPTAWLSLDESDKDPARFFSYLLAALNKAYTRLKIPIPPEGQLSQTEVQEDLLVPLINRIGDSPEGTILVLDDYHLVQNQAVHDAMGYLLEHLPPQAHILIATRSDPPLPMTRLRGRGQVHELRLEDLQFSNEEALSFLGTFTDIGLTPDDIQTLTRRTEGWISGLQMAAVSLRGHEDKAAFIRTFSGSHHYIMDYLLDEVLRRQTPHHQEFLLNTSILKRMCGSLCDALLDSTTNGGSSGAEILKDLEHANLFIVPLDDRREWYRYHRLFGDLLQERLERAHPERIPSLHHQASKWLDERGLMDEAVDHALSTLDYAFAADLIERSSQEIMMRSETLTLLRWLGRLPEAEIQNRPKLGIYRSWALLFHGAPLSTVESHIQKSSVEIDPPGSAQSLQSFIALCQGEIKQGLELAQVALEELPEEEIFLRDFATLCAISARISLGEMEEGILALEQTYQDHQLSRNRAGAVNMLCEIAELQQRQLQLTESQRLYERALAIATDGDGKHLPVAGRALMGLGGLALERFDLEKAAELVQEGIKLAEGWNLINTLDGHISMAQIFAARGENEALLETLETLKAIVRKFDASEFDDIVVDFLDISLKAKQHNLDDLREWVTSRGLDQAPERKPAHYDDDLLRAKLYRYELPILARLRIAEERYTDALEILEELSTLARQPKRPYLQIEADILRAMTLDRSGDKPGAITALRHALELAMPQGMMRLFLTEGVEVIKLLKAGRPEWKSPALTLFVDQLLLKAGVTIPSEPIFPGGTLEPLSSRELEVLSLLPSGSTAEELADQLIISVNTVRTHLKSIYAKMGVHSRHEAVAKATELDLL